MLRDTKTYSSEVGGAATIEDLPEDVLAARRNFLEFDPPKHGRYRRLISKQFTPGAVARYEEWLRELVRYRLDTVLPLGEFDLVHELAAPIPIRVLAHILGLPEEILPHLVDLGDRLLVDTDPEYVGEHAYAGERDEYRYKPFGSPWADELCAIGREYYADRRACPRDDVLSLIANGEIEGAADVRAGPRQHVRAADRGRQRDDAAGDQPRDARARRASLWSISAFARILR